MLIFKKNLKLFLLSTILLFANTLFSQTTKSYFDRIGKACTESQAYFYRVKSEKENEYKSYYINGDNIYFEGKILKPSETDADSSTFTGECVWYFKNGKKKAIRSFDENGNETGISTLYYESGKLWKEIEYVKGKVKGNVFKEYDETGKVSLTFEEDFNNNKNDWDLYTSDKTSATIKDGKLKLVSFTKEGAARHINLPTSSEDFIIDASVNVAKTFYNEKAGIIFGFKDWQNYNFFLISQTSFYVGTVYEGVSIIKANGMYSADIKKSEYNVIKVIAMGEKNVYSINGSIQYSSDRTRNYGSNIGFSMSGKGTVTIDNFIFKQIDYKGSNVISGTDKRDLNVKATGSGIFISTSGYILTNYHVIDDANKIQIEVNEQGSPKSYYAKVVQKDVDNDLAILKIEDEAFQPLANLNYSFVESGSADVGATVFTIGFPYALSGMGKDAKFTDGKISAKTGYNGAINSYQTSVPIQPGNSGGPLFNEKGELIGVMNSVIKAADNVSYAIKINYIKNLMDLLSDSTPFPNNKSLATSSTEEKVKVLTQYVVLIKIK